MNFCCHFVMFNVFLRINTCLIDLVVLYEKNTRKINTNISVDFYIQFSNDHIKRIF